MGCSEVLSVASAVTACATISACSASTTACTLYAYPFGHNLRELQHGPAVAACAVGVQSVVMLKPASDGAEVDHGASAARPMDCATSLIIVRSHACNRR
jgi:hypothetical protein